jgi:hypothetical protein
MSTSTSLHVRGILNLGEFDDIVILRTFGDVSGNFLLR